MKNKKPKYYIATDPNLVFSDQVFYIVKNGLMYFSIVKYIGHASASFICEKETAKRKKGWSDKTRYRKVKPPELVLMFSPDQLYEIKNMGEINKENITISRI